MENEFSNDQLFRFFPGEVWTTKVAKNASFLKNWLPKTQIPAWTRVNLDFISIKKRDASFIGR